MGKGISGLILKAMGGRDYILTIQHSEKVAPRYQRIYASAPELVRKIAWAPGEWLRFWIPDTEHADQLYQRAFTIARLDVENDTLQIEISLHEHGGPGSEWAEMVEPGDQILVTSMGSKPFHLLENRKGLLILGDSASLPTVNAILDSVPASIETRVILEHSSNLELQNPLSSRSDTEIVRVERKGVETFAQALGTMDFSGWQIWANGEAGSLTEVRRLLKTTSSIAKEDLHMQAYWNNGKPMGNARKAR